MAEYTIKLDFPTTNNRAEYETLIDSLGLAITLRVKNLQVCRGSRLVVFQLIYGAEVVVPLKVTHTSHRVQQFDP